MKRYCPKHPQERMTLLLNDYICDICSPPKGMQQVVKQNPSPTNGNTYYFAAWRNGGCFMCGKPRDKGWNNNCRACFESNSANEVSNALEILHKKCADGYNQRNALAWYAGPIKGYI